MKFLFFLLLLPQDCVSISRHGADKVRYTIGALVRTSFLFAIAQKTHGIWTMFFLHIYTVSESLDNQFYNRLTLFRICRKSHKLYSHKFKMQAVVIGEERKRCVQRNCSFVAYFDMRELS